MTCGLLETCKRNVIYEGDAERGRNLVQRFTMATFVVICRTTWDDPLAVW